METKDPCKAHVKFRLADIFRPINLTCESKYLMKSIWCNLGMMIGQNSSQSTKGVLKKEFLRRWGQYFCISKRIDQTLCGQHPFVGETRISVDLGGELVVIRSGRISAAMENLNRRFFP